MDEAGIGFANIKEDMEDKKKRRIIIICIIAVLIVALVFGILWQIGSRMQKPTALQSKAVTADVPVMNSYYNGEGIGTITGYTNELDTEKVRDVIILISPQRQTEIKIDNKGNKIENIKYELKNTTNDNLIDSGDVDDLKQNDKSSSFTYTATAIMEVGAEYRLDFIIETNQHQAVYYYARAMVMDKDIVPEQIKFAKKINDRTFNEKQVSDLAGYLEPDPKLRNDNLGEVTLHNSYTCLIWATMAPKKIGSMKTTAKEFYITNGGYSGTYTFNYQIENLNAEDNMEKFNVAETITVWSYKGRQYILGFDRKVNQIWEANADNVGSKFIDLGVQAEKTIGHMESPNEKYLTYAINGDVYVMDMPEKKVTPIFKLNAKSYKQLQQTKARVVEVDDQGNVDYMIYGYSPADNHKGRNGISIMRYSAKDNKSTERVFIPCRNTADILDIQLSTLCHVGDGTLYLMLEDAIYYANLRTHEWGVIADELENDSYAVSGDGSILAFNTNGKNKKADSITVINLDSGKKHVIHADDGELITVCGYTGTNLIYGTIKKSDVDKVNFLPINKLTILDKNFNETKTYEKEGVFIKDIEVTDTIINIKRNKNGKDISDDQLLDNTKQAEESVQSSFYKDDVKLKELALAFRNPLNKGKTVEVEKQGEVEFVDEAEVNTSLEKSSGNSFYVYGYGELQGIVGNKAKAIAEAKKCTGLIVDGKGKKIWTIEDHYK